MQLTFQRALSHEKQQQQPLIRKAAAAAALTRSWEKEFTLSNWNWINIFFLSQGNLPTLAGSTGWILCQISWHQPPPSLGGFLPAFLATSSVHSCKLGGRFEQTARYARIERFANLFANCKLDSPQSQQNDDLIMSEMYNILLSKIPLTDAKMYAFGSAKQEKTLPSMQHPKMWKCEIFPSIIFLDLLRALTHVLVIRERSVRKFVFSHLF